jgi:plastocyanin
LKNKLPCVFVLPALLLAAGTMSVLASQVSLASAAGNPVVVTMTDKPARYVPEKITVRVGTTVEFRNTGQVVHDVTTDAAIVQNKNDVSLPPDAKSFDSGFIPPGQSWSYTFTVPGRYLYACIPHEKDRMVGEVVVTK